MTVTEICQRARAASVKLSRSGAAQRNAALNEAARLLSTDGNMLKLLKANAEDLASAEKNGISEVMKDRLRIDDKRIFQMADALRELASFPDVLGRGECFTLENGLEIKKVTVPLGTVGIIYESRPNVTADAAGICIKTGNASVLRGGKEAVHTNSVLAEIMSDACEAVGLDRDSVCFISDTDRAAVTEMMQARGLLDVLIPRGGKGLINAVCSGSAVPVIETGAGNCHIYVEKSADISLALKVAKNAKLQRPSVCNAAESLLIDREILQDFLPAFYEATREKRLEFRCCPECREVLPNSKAASEEDFYTEYNDYTISCKAVSGVEEAIEHINLHSTHHSDAIITRDTEASRLFTAGVDSAAVYVNASTRFTDGGVFGFGAEIGISTQKLHARGPMGPSALTSVKYVVVGSGQIRE